MKIPLKRFYKLQEATELLNKELGCSYFSIDCLIDLAVRGEIILGIEACKKAREVSFEVGCICPQPHLFNNDEILKRIRFIHSINNCLEVLGNVGTLLILNKSSVNKYFSSEDHINLHELEFDNVFSSETEKMCVAEDAIEYFEKFRYTDSLFFQRFYDQIYYTDTEIIGSTQIKIEVDEDGIERAVLLDGRLVEENWEIGFCIKNNYDVEYEYGDIRSKTVITRDDLVIVAKDIEQILEKYGNNSVSNQENLIDQLKLEIQNLEKKLNFSRQQIKKLETQLAEEKSTTEYLSPMDEIPHSKTRNKVSILIAALCEIAKIDMIEPFGIENKKILDAAENLRSPLGKDFVGKWLELANENTK